MFTINVNDSETKNFYVIKDDGEKVTLIMDRNLGNKVAWYKDNDDTTNNEKNALGPITALNYLTSEINSETETWTNVPAIESYEYINNENGTTNTNGYQKLIIINGAGKLTSQDGTIETELEGTMRARLLTEDEASTLGCTTTHNSCPSWLYRNLSDENTPEAPHGYWFLTTYPSSYYSCYGRYMRYSGNSNSSRVYSVTTGGARPVIELFK